MDGRLRAFLDAARSGSFRPILLKNSSGVIQRLRSYNNVRILSTSEIKNVAVAYLNVRMLRVPSASFDLGEFFNRIDPSRTLSA